jgi:aldose sugar dehydrogenase
MLIFLFIILISFLHLNILLGSGRQVLAQQTINDPKFKSETVFEGLDFPTDMAFLGPSDVLVLEKDKGTVSRIVNSQLLDEPLLDVPVATKGERGMLGIAVDGGENQKEPFPNVFLYYTESNKSNTEGDNDITEEDPIGNRIYKFNLNDDQLRDGKLLLDLPAAISSDVTPFHNGGKLLIGPDETLFAVIGDLNTRRTQAQNIVGGENPDGTSTIYRITYDGDAVEGNPFEDVDTFAKYYAYGLRNSFGLEIDPITGYLWDTENGPDYGDEINLVQPGFNSGALYVYGLSSEKDNFDPKKLVELDGKGKYSDPEFTWDVPVGVTALQFLDSDKYGDEYKNDMFVGDVNKGNIYHFDLNEDRTELLLDDPLTDKIANNLEESNEVIFGKGFGGITDLEIGPDGYLYVLAIKRFHEDNTGTIYRIVPVSV